MNPVSDLSVLLKTLEPELNPGVFVFASVKDGNAIDPAVIVASIREPEGLSVVTSEVDARISGLNAFFKCAWITLTVNSASEAVGLTAAFASALGNSGISCNVVAGAYHDHIFVPLESAETAMHVLRLLQTDGVTAQQPANSV
ncbi:ACT domain-containing protein [Caballeronia telluris]|uniref:Acetyltransferase n=1 Tax=Caballeronia telluris TaxID=326475 RepID=A0A158KJ40_9BURK|nr:ACT domain-containing protein [Caballeronia telluris]SAL80763.1 acetyltransferase [Caballeronia telluris]